MHEPVHSELSSSSASKTVFRNYPLMCETYTDPDNQKNMVLVAISLPGGADNVKFVVSNDGTSVIVTYDWPKTMYTMDDLFVKQIADEGIPVYHPKILAIENGLRKCRQRIDAVPEATINVKLPIKVQTAGAGPITKSGIERDDGTKIVMVELVGEYQKPVAFPAHYIVFDK